MGSSHRRKILSGHPALPETPVALFSFLLHFVWEFLQVPTYAGMAEMAHWQGIKFCTAATIGDVGFAIQAAAARYDLGFVPLGQDHYCLAVRSSIASSSAIRHLIRRFLGNTFHERLAALPGYEATAASNELLPWEQFTAALNDNSR